MRDRKRLKHVRIRALLLAYIMHTRTKVCTSHKRIRLCVSHAGLARGAYAVGYMYELGLGVPQNLEGALERYRGVALMASQLPLPDSAAIGEARGASLKALALAAQVMMCTCVYCTL
jgi:hypothetical protein